MLNHRLYKIKLKYFFFISFFFLNSFSANSVELIVKQIKNPIKLIDKYGNNFFINENYIFKNGDFINSTDENSYLILNGIKICLGVNSSLKFNEIFNKKNEIFIEHLKGSIFINQRTNYKIKIKIKIFKNLISDFKHKIYTNIFDKNKFILQSFSKINFIQENKKSKNLEKNITYLFSDILKKTKIVNISEDPLFKECESKEKKIQLNEQKKFKCVPRGSELVCGYR
tara:strand:- start:12 stop:692 length:681 start_codon:yes stop_codon:yes gene_type:complete